MTTEQAASTAEEVANPEVTPPESPESAPVTPPSPEDTGALSPTAEGTEGAAAEPAPTAEGASDGGFDVDGYFAEKFKGTAEPETPQQAPRYGLSPEDRALQTYQLNQRATANLMQESETQHIQWAQTELGLDADAARKSWLRRRQELARAADLPQGAINALLRHAMGAGLADALGKEAVDELFANDQDYSPDEFIKAIDGRGRDAVKREWESNKGKTWVSMDEAKQAVRDALTQQRGAIDKQIQEGTYRSDTTDVTASATAGARGGSYQNVDQLAAAYIDESSPIYKDRVAYEREHVRLTGKKPGER